MDALTSSSGDGFGLCLGLDESYCVWVCVSIRGGIKICLRSVVYCLALEGPKSSTGASGGF